jgi:hypothetical protein
MSSTIHITIRPCIEIYKVLECGDEVEWEEEKSNLNSQSIWTHFHFNNENDFAMRDE